MFSKAAIGQHFFDNPMGVKYSITVIKNLLFFYLSICLFNYCIFFRNCLHHVIQAKLVPPKRACLQPENLVLITRLDAFLKHPIIFVQL